MSRINKREFYNVRLEKDACGNWVFDDRCYMHRLSHHKNSFISEWVEASATDRALLTNALRVKK